MKKIKVNGKEYTVDKQVTVLEFLKEIGIYVPTLCYHPNLRKVGSCRVCVILDRGRYRNSCATYVEDGMDIQTDTPELTSIRKWTLQLLFSERNHYCMYCAVTNDCEFQRLGYYTGLDHFHFPTFKNIFELDTSHPHILLDNNRCVLCTRCVRACSEVAGHSVLNINNKGLHSLVVADNGVPLGESSCTSCGLCVQVCPTGTLVDKYSLFLGRREQVQTQKSHCFVCPVGCGLEVHTRGGNIVKVYSDWDSFTKGLICYKGRYELILEYRKNNQQKKYGKLELQKALEIYKDRIDKNSIAVIDGTLFNEELELIKSVFSRVKVAYPINPKILENNLTIDDLDKYQTYIISGWDLNKEYGALGSIIKRNALHKDHKMINLDTLRENEIKRVKNMVVGKALYIYKNYPKHVLDGFDELVLPIGPNDIGVLKTFGVDFGKAAISESDLTSDTTMFVFSRELKINLDNLTKKVKKSLLFTFYLNGHVKNFNEITMIPSQYDISGRFYNLFNQILSVSKI